MGSFAVECPGLAGGVSGLNARNPTSSVEVCIDRVRRPCRLVVAGVVLEAICFEFAVQNLPRCETTVWWKRASAPLH